MRGPHPKDRLCFRPEAMRVLSAVAVDLRYLLGRGYSQAASLKLVSDHVQLLDRQRKFLFRAVMPPELARAIRHRRVVPEALAGAAIWIDGFNVLITIETALAGGPLLEGDDGFLRDIAAQHGGYRPNEHTEPAVARLVAALRDLGVARAAILFDRPVSNSGRMAARMRAALLDAGVEGDAQVANSPDREIAEALAGAAPARPPAVAATSDSILLARVPSAFDLARHVVEQDPAAPWILRLDAPPNPLTSGPGSAPGSGPGRC
ncbi:MAG: DUF434 domain-containing protein [Planctomycetes bacterium]|nr:DUF434 domain-containing protein [Planctomycetota bacterium]